MKIIDAGDGLVIKSDDHVAFGKACFFSRAGGFNRYYQDAAFDSQIVSAHEATVQRHILPADANVAEPHSTVSYQAASDEFGSINRYGKTDALRGQNDRGIDAYNISARIHQRPAGIAGVERRIGLDHVVDQPPGARAQRAPERRDDAGRHGRFEAERIADRDDQLADFELARPAEARDGQITRVDLDDGEVGQRA